jgi:hypothetical protein
MEGERSAGINADIRNSRFEFWLELEPKDPSSIQHLGSIVTNEIYRPLPKYITSLTVSSPASRPFGLSIYFLRKEQPSVNRALPPVGWHRTCEQPWQTTTVLACEKTVVMVKQPGHLTSMKKDRGPGTSCLSLCLRASA